jgi:nitrilase
MTTHLGSALVIGPTAIRLGTASPATQATTAATLSQLAIITRKAAGLGIDILLLPEAYLGGYPRGSSFGSAVGSRSAEGRDEFLRHWNRAIDLGDVVGDGQGGGERWVSRGLRVGSGSGSSSQMHSAATEDWEDEDGLAKSGDGTREEIEEIARHYGVFLVVGIIEKAGGSLYCSVVYVDPKRGMVGKRRKVMPVSLHVFLLSAISSDSLTPG